MTFELQIRIRGDAPGSSLQAWLARDPIADRLELEALPGDPETMGGGELFQAIVQDTASLGGLVLAIMGWVHTHRKPKQSPSADLEVTLERNGTVVAITGSDPDDVARVIRDVTE